MKVCSYLNKLFQNYDNNWYVHSYILHKHEKGGTPKQLLVSTFVNSVCAMLTALLLLIHNVLARFDVPEALLMKIQIFWDVTPCRLAHTDRHAAEV